MKFPVIDGHCDTAQALFLQPGQTLTDSTCSITLSGMEKLGRYAQFFAFCPVWTPGWEAPALYEQSREYFLEQLRMHREKITLCGSRGQMEDAWCRGKAAAFLSLEGAEAVECDPGRLEEAAEQGVRMVSLTWNYENPLGGTNVTGGGLTARGREFVRRAQRLGMIVDVSHASDQVFFDICQIAERPVVASHSNCRSVCGHPRNLTDDQLRCLAQLGGTAGLNLWGAVLTGEDRRPTLDDVRRHLEHFLEIGGETLPALGGDLDGCSDLPEGFAGVESYEAVEEFLLQAGFPLPLTEKIFAGNLQRVMDACGLKPV